MLRVRAASPPRHVPWWKCQVFWWSFSDMHAHTRAHTRSAGSKPEDVHIFGTITFICLAAGPILTHTHKHTHIICHQLGCSQMMLAIGKFHLQYLKRWCWQEMSTCTCTDKQTLDTHTSSRLVVTLETSCTDWPLWSATCDHAERQVVNHSLRACTQSSGRYMWNKISGSAASLAALPCSAQQLDINTPMMIWRETLAHKRHLHYLIHTQTRMALTGVHTAAKAQQSPYENKFKFTRSSEKTTDKKHKHKGS